MVHHFDLEQLPRAHQVPCHFDVLLARGGIAAGMVMDEDDGGRPSSDGADEHLPGRA